MANADVETFKAQLNIVELAEQLTEVQHTGTGALIHCPDPDHEDKKPSCTLYAATNSWHCFSQAHHGDVIKLIELLNGQSFQEALAWASVQSGIPAPTLDPEAQARANALKLLKTHLAEELEFLPPETELPHGLTLEKARALGLGYAHNLSAAMAQIPRKLLTPQEVAAWEGGWTLELYGRGSLLGFGCFLPVKNEPDSELVTDEEEIFDEDDWSDDDEEDFVEPATVAETAEELGETPQEISLEQSIIESSLEESRLPRSKPSPLPLNLPSPILGPWATARELRAPAFAGLAAAQKTIASRKAVAVSPDLAIFMELVANNFPGVITPGEAIDTRVAKALASLAPKLIVIISSDYRRHPNFWEHLRTLAATGAKIELLAYREEEGLGEKLTLFDYLAEGIKRTKEAGREAGLARMLATMEDYLSVLPSASTRELYRQELKKRNLYNT